MRTVSLHLFDYDPSTRILSAEISDLGPNPFYQVYNDAIDEGITIISHHTGRDATFVVDHVESTAEGELQKWELIPTADTLRKLPAAKGMKVYLYND